MNTQEIEKKAETLLQQLGGLIFAFPIDLARQSITPTSESMFGHINAKE